MAARRRSGAAVCLLAVFCVAAGCAAAQQQQQPSAVFSTTPDELWRFIEQAVRVELQPLVSKLESRVDALDSRLVKLDSRVDELTVRLFDNNQNPQSDELSSRLNIQQSQLDELATKVDSQISQIEMIVTKVNSPNIQLDGLIAEVDSQKSQRENLTTQLGSQESQMTRLVTKQDSQQAQLALLTDTSTSERSRLDGVSNKTASQQHQIDELTVRLDQVESEGELGGSDQLPRDCSELPAGAKSGVHLLQLGVKQVQAYCDMENDGGNWMVFQRRGEMEPHQDFDLGWAAYKDGFGQLTGEFWWGLQNLWKMTSAQDREYQLRINLEDFAGEKAHAVYERFQISSEEDGFRLSAFSYSGDAGDGLVNSVKGKFSTPDKNQDGGSYHCAQWYKGPWWYDPSCGYSSLNGKYQDGPVYTKQGIWWQMWKGFTSLKKTEMKIRRV